MIRRIGTLTFAAALLAAGAQLPRKAPDFTVYLNGGKKIQLSEYKGKPVVLAFILTTCSHCQHTTGLLSKAQTDFGPRGLQVIESSIEQGGEAFVPRFIQSFNPPFPVGFNDYMVAQDFMQHSPMLLLHMPGVVFIDRQGNIVAQYEGDAPEMAEEVQEKNLRARIEEILGPAGAARTSGQKSAAKKK
jgi:cytochrome oxidase Cu insertion factor (SCO1/SenC/PrrC family)